MEHSVQKYLEGLSTPELEAALSYCLEGENGQSYEHVIGEILCVLEKRGTLGQESAKGGKASSLV